MTKIEKVVIIGSGPAGWSAAVYAARELLDPLLVSGHEIGGQLMLTTEIENYPGFENPVKGGDLMKAMENQAKKYGTRVMTDYVKSVNLEKKPFTVQLQSGGTIMCHSLIVATGASAKWLGIESEARFKGYGVSSCATCDGFFFKDQKVCVVGGGNTAMEEALHLTKYASRITMLVRGASLKGEKLLMQRVNEQEKIEVLFNTEVLEFCGEETGSMKELRSVKVKDNAKDKVFNLEVAGVFIAIGYHPKTDIFQDQLKTEKGYIVTEADSTRTSVEGVYAAGDVQDSVFRQAITSAATGCMAALEASRYLANLTDKQ